VKNVLSFLFLICLLNVNAQEKHKTAGAGNSTPWSVRMAQSQMKRYPQAWKYESKAPFWGYHQGIVVKAMLDMWKHTGDKTYFDYARSYSDSIVGPHGMIKTYSVEAYNIDMVNPGKIFFPLYKETGDDKYKKAAATIRDQLRTHPRTSEGGFWHKRRYPHQMWLDGLYMGTPFLAQYAKDFNEPATFDDAVKQITLMARHTYDPKTGLYYHAWDESKEQRWANKETGQSPHFWARSIGWFGMALVDAMDHLPEDQPGRKDVIDVIKNVAAGIRKYQDKRSGVWYQVVDQGNRKGNYLESSASSMFVYFLYKAARKGYVDPSYKTAADKGYKGLLKNFIRENSDGTISLTRCCAVAGLGGEPYRDGSFEYYISEPIKDNDTKGVGPFIWASMEHEMTK
jgi:unsaturated rhamnogalacturonyl hydrolase